MFQFFTSKIEGNISVEQISELRKETVSKVPQLAPKDYSTLPQIFEVTKS